MAGSHANENAVKALRRIAPHDPLHLAAIPVNGGMFDARVFAEGSEADMAAWIAAREREQRNLYYTHGVVSLDFAALCNANPRGKRPNGTGEIKPAVKPMGSEILTAWGAHIDLDPPPGEMTEEQRVEWRKAVLAAADDLVTSEQLRQPSTVINSGGGLQMLWRFAEPVEPDRFSEVEELNRDLGALFASVGVAPDGTQNIDRLLRVPGTVNRPDKRKQAKGRVPAKAQLIRHAGPVYDFEGLRTVTPTRPVETPNTATGNRALPPSDHPLLQALPDPLPPTSGDAFEDLEGYALGPRTVRLIAGGVGALDEGERARKADAMADTSGSGYAWEVYCDLARARVPSGLAVAVLFCADYAISSYMHDRGETPEKLLKHDFVNAVERVGANAPFWSEDAPAEARPKGKSPPFVRDKNGVPVAKHQRNVRLAIESLGVRVRHDLFADRCLIDGLAGVGPWLGDVEINRLWLAIDERFGMLPPIDFYVTVVNDYARQNAFHPVREYLARVEPDWDGTKRLDSWLIDYGGAEDSDFVRAVGALTLLAAVRRVRHPGSKFDEMLVLEGTQGVGKSSAIEALMPEPQWFSDNFSFSNRDREVLENLAGRWVIEAPELKGMRKADAEARKAFMSRQTDRGRLAYARTVSEVPRCCVFIGTTNDDRYLTDPTGNRRFWPVRVEGFDLAAIRRDRDQLWAEAATREATGASIRLDPRLYHEAARSQQARRVEDPWGRLIADALGGLTGKIDPVRLWDIVGVEKARRTQADNDRLGTIMRDLGWDRKKRRLRGFKTTRWAYIKGESTEEKGQEIFVQWEGGDAFATREPPF
jgi:predicted P-loop ATPase